MSSANKETDKRSLVVNHWDHLPQLLFGSLLEAKTFDELKMEEEFRVEERWTKWQTSPITNR